MCLLYSIAEQILCRSGERTAEAIVQDFSLWEKTYLLGKEKSVL